MKSKEKKIEKYYEKIWAALRKNETRIVYSYYYDL